MMEPKVLVVDDDAAWLRLTEKELEPFDDEFAVVTAQDGQSALDVLKTDHVTLVVTDLRMPGVDGFELISHIQSHYPDIPVVAITGYDRPKTRDVVLKSGAAAYMTKPMETKDLGRQIKKILKQKAEGGSLHKVSLETYLQLVEMEQQTCTLRVTDKSSGKMGVLFFRDGDLMQARCRDVRGRDAAYEILSWSGVSLMIEPACTIEQKQVDGELQALLLDAMRSKDESLDEENELAETEQTASSAILLDDPMQAGSNPSTDSAAAADAETESAAGSQVPDAEAAVPPAETNPGAAENAAAAEPESFLDGLRQKLVNALGQRGGIREVYEDGQYDGLLEQSAAVGDIFDAGQLNVIYIHPGRDSQFLIAPGEQTVLVTLEPDTPRDRVIGLLA